MNNTPLENKIIEYWHLSKTIQLSRYNRLLQVKAWLLQNDFEMISHLSNKKLWLLIEETTAPTKPI